MLRSLEVLVAALVGVGGLSASVMSLVAEVTVGSREPPAAGVLEGEIFAKSEPPRSGCLGGGDVCGVISPARIEQSGRSRACLVTAWVFFPDPAPPTTLSQPRRRSVGDKVSSAN